MSEKKNIYRNPVLVAGNSRLLYSVCACLMQSGHPVTYLTDRPEDELESISTQIKALHADLPHKLDGSLNVTKILDAGLPFGLAIGLTDENLVEKQNVLSLLENNIPLTTTLCINTESIPLSILQEHTLSPGRIIGLNWVEPAHTTFFLEIITNSQTGKECAEEIFNLAKKHWSKDPYLLLNDCGIRAKMISAMAREAFYLVENGYASVEDVDRACRNDAGYYLPFAGNCRYMDLMGTYAYGLVMKDLNPELSNSKELPDFFSDIVKNGGMGMENKGFYDYQDGDHENWNKLFKKFSHSIMEVIHKYPFNYSDQTSTVDKNQDS